MMFEGCIADRVVVNEEEIALANVRGFATVQFSQNSVCRYMHLSSKIPFPKPRELYEGIKYSSRGKLSINIWEKQANLILPVTQIDFFRENLGIQAVESHWGEKGPNGRTVVTLDEGKLREAFFVDGVASGIVRGWR